MYKFLVTGAAGFIGAKCVEELLLNNFEVIGLDNLNNYYNPALKKKRLENISNSLKKDNYWKFFNIDITDTQKLNEVFKKFEPDIVLNVAAQAGVRYSIDNPSAYIKSNLVGFGNILEMCRKFKVKHLLYASSSSVYGANRKLPYSESDPVNHPISLYAATKRSNELMAHSYSHLYKMNSTGLRFFTVYGPWGRPDMAPMKFAKLIMENKEIDVFNNGNMIRDFTYIDDVIESIYKLISKFPESNPNYNKKDANPCNSWSPYKIFNVGNSKSVKLMDYIKCLEKKLNISAKINNLPMQMGDVRSTEANTELLESWIGFKPNTSIESGINSFEDWYN